MTDLTLKCLVHQPNPEDKEHVLAEPKYHDAEKLDHFLCTDSVPHCPFCTCTDFRGNWRNLTLSGKQSAWELEKLQSPHWFTKPNLVMMWTKDKWFSTVLGSGWEPGISSCFWLPQVLAKPTWGWFVYCVEVVSVTWLGYSFSSQYQPWQFSVWHLMSSVNCLCFISFAGMNRGKWACRSTGNIFPDREMEAFITQKHSSVSVMNAKSKSVVSDLKIWDQLVLLNLALNSAYNLMWDTKY